MKTVKYLLTIVAFTVLLASCSQESSCPVAVKNEYYFKKKVKVKHGKKKPTASLIHVSRVTYKPTKY